MTNLHLDPRCTALVAIDLQRGIVALNTAPRPATEVVQNTSRLADAVRRSGGLVVWIRVSNSEADALRPEVDTPAPSSSRPADWAELVPELGASEDDLVITKRQWGAFYGTELDLQLRRRGIRTILLTGIATQIGVESTARAAYELGYGQVFVEDAMASPSGEAHAFTLKNIFPRIGRVRSTQDVIDAIAAGERP